MGLKHFAETHIAHHVGEKKGEELFNPATSHGKHSDPVKTAHRAADLGMSHPDLIVPFAEGFGNGAEKGATHAAGLDGYKGRHGGRHSHMNVAHGHQPPIVPIGDPEVMPVSNFLTMAKTSPIADTTKNSHDKHHQNKKTTQSPGMSIPGM